MTTISDAPVPFDPKIPGTGWLMRRSLDGFVAKLVNGLAVHAASVVPERPGFTRAVETSASA